MTDTRQMTETDLMKLIHTLDSQASLHFSNHTEQWYVHARIDEKEGSGLTSITVHCDTPREALEEYVHRLKESRTTDGYLVTDAFDRNKRRAWRWNGVGFMGVAESRREWP